MNTLLMKEPSRLLVKNKNKAHDIDRNNNRSISCALFLLIIYLLIATDCGIDGISEPF